MENLTAYLDDSLVPLERKIKEYLELEGKIRKLEVEIINLKAKATAPGNHQKQEEGTTEAKSSEDNLKEDEQLLDIMLQRYREMQNEVIKMLPEQNKFIEIDLGYGPSMVGYFTVDLETHTQLPEPVLRVVH
ncbi:hypothetical protein ACFSRY_14740 [Pontibacter locisalis]|uniref:Uncharacterized protein n=1 Tax=Pontibacter locisalis TaxID=1719035 RepID=A0ABW5IQ74_9BACT